MADDTNLTKKKSIPKPTQGISAKIWKGNEEYEHSLFKLLPTISLANDSFRAFRPNIKKKNHAHFYHSVDKKGRPNTHCAPMAGHSHEITIEWDGDTLKSMKCGPPVRYKWKPTRSGEMKRVRERVVYKGEARDGTTDIHDDHVHELQYIRSEIIRKGTSQQASTQHLFAGQNKYSPETLALAQASLKEKS